MKILWITNIMMPDVCKAFGRAVSSFGGWMISGANYLSQSKNVELGIASLYDGTTLWQKEINKISYYLLPGKASMNKYNNSLEVYWKQVKELFKPDVVHIHGSEYPTGLAYVSACGNSNVVLSIQGMTSVYADYYFAEIPSKTIINNLSISDIVFGKSIFSGYRDYKKRGLLEEELISKLNYVIGRTSWDYMHVRDINPDIQYFKCNETLRPSFYSGEWKLENCNKYSIFVPQAWYPIKGLHFAIKAFAKIKSHYPTATLHIAGANIIHHSNLKEKLLISGYGRIINSMIKKYGLSDSVSFTGLLDEEGMKKEYLKAHVFLCPSSIENSPNSLGEAQLLGTPCISSFVGGVGDMILQNETGFYYRFDDVSMLAGYIFKVFEDDQLAESLSKHGKKVASERHCGEINNRTLISIYNRIYNDNQLAKISWK